MKSKDSENSRKKQPIDKQKSMLLEPKELLKRAKEWLEKEKSSNKPRDKESKPTSNWPDKSNSKRRLKLWLSRLEWREKTTCIRSRNKSRSSSRKERSRRTESRPSSITLPRSEPRLESTKISRNKKDWTSWSKAERCGRKSTRREIRSKTSKQPR